MIAILQETKVSFLITDVGQLENMKSVEATLHTQLKGLLLVDMYDELKRLDEEKKTEEKAKILQTIDSLKEKNIQIFDFEDILEKGRKAYIPPFMQQDPERIFTLVYTSGTTGNPKGVMLSNRNFVRELQGCLGINSYTLMLGEDFLHFALLPLSHVFERMVEYVAYGHGASVAYFSRRKELLVDDLKSCHPSCMIMVPRVAVLILDSIESQIQNLPFYKRSILQFALNRKLQARRSFVHTQATLASKNSFTLPDSDEEDEDQGKSQKMMDSRILLPPKIQLNNPPSSSSQGDEMTSTKNLSTSSSSPRKVSSLLSLSPSQKGGGGVLVNPNETASSYLVSKISSILSPFSSSASSCSSSSSSTIDEDLFYRHTPPLKGLWYDRLLSASTTLQTRLFGEAGRIRFLLSGGGKLNPIVQEKLEAYLSTSFIQGWGMTETCGAGCWQARLGDGALDNAGGPNPVLEMKLKSWDQYNAEKSEYPQGELLLRGESIFEGYFRQPEMTKEIFLFEDEEDGGGVNVDGGEKEGKDQNDQKKDGQGGGQRTNAEEEDKKKIRRKKENGEEDGYVQGILSKFNQMEVLRSSIERRASSNWLKENTSRQRS
ncbi:amp-binding enzyme domain-containing protein [Cystoisospora suis]|uniref:Amp-binding enzyme domain-containing protein n=1 Tax=Cystoisospora suis TaxID=483139 RepID=A0A2C6KFD7_9APIC|nr:amp-binding enzyme domain-containing protein [Cystoisospora suis]